MNKWKKSVRAVLITLFIICVAFCVCICVFQRRLLYVPTQIPAKAVEQIAAEHGFVPWKNSSGQIIGWKIPATENSLGSVLIVHGNAGCAAERDYLARPIHEATNLDVFVLEYPGYGARPGSPSKKSFDAAAEAAFQLLPKNLPKYVVSESIGTGVACDLAQNHPREIAGMVLFVPYHNLAAVAQRKMWFLPTYFLLFDRFNPAAALKNYRNPIKFIIAEKDEVIGAASGLKLANGYNGPKQIRVIPNAHHNEVEEQSPEWWREAFVFWRQNAGK